MHNSHARDALIAQIIQTLAKNSDAASIPEEFVSQYLSLLSYEDLREHSVLDWSGLILSHWQFMQGRSEDETKIRVFNPDYATHGWTSPHTVIEISTKDVPFLVDSARMEVNRHNLGIHFIIHVGGMRTQRDAHNNISEVLAWNDDATDTKTEAPIHIEIDRTTDAKQLESLQSSLEKVMRDVHVAVADWHAMREKVNQSIKELEENPPDLEKAEIEESIDFLHWLENNNFTFLGCRDYDLVGDNQHKALKMIPESGLGVLRDTTHSLKYRNFSDMTPEAINLMLSPEALIIAKTNTESSVHRPVYTDYIGVKRFDTHGCLIGERRFIGLFTSTAYSSSVQTIPYFRSKVAKIMEGSRLVHNSHARKALLNILETFPRNDLFQGEVNELKDIAMGIFNLQERNRVRLFARKDIYGRYISCYVYIPKYRFTNELRKEIQSILEWGMAGKVTEYNTYFGDSVLARIHYIIRIEPQDSIEYDVHALEQQIITAATSWKDHLRQILLDYYGEEQGNNLYEKYQFAFPAGYRERNSATTGVGDIKHLNQLSYSTPLILNLYKNSKSEANQFDFKIYQLHKTAPLSDVMPILENMGMRVVGENPYEIKRYDGNSIWINDFHMEFEHDKPINLNAIKANFQQAFAKIWNGTLENDDFNQLILLAQLNWQQVMLLRALAKYMRQIGTPYSQQYVATTFIHYPQIAKMLVELFCIRFAPDFNEQSVLNATNIESRINQALEEVVSLDEDKILRIYLSLIKALLRTNFFQTKNGQPKSYVSFKFDPALIPNLPLPRPEFEIFVYSPRFEAVHLRSGKVARGGLRWSDRREDFRTEVLGLMKAQQVKNSVIVPTGAKGGFYVKNLKRYTSREDQQKEAIHCYQNFIRGMLDITDNYEGNEIVTPDDVIHYDDLDPYLVVAADKGTATFSDIANEISKEYQFWLGDAFASGGKTGYDHKKMGITARGAWISVARHFKNINVNVAKEDFSVVGIGDMSGDVFGNGMLLSPHICLVAAFNHEHIFIDPEPNAAESFQERKRLFELPRSSWSDYNKELISKGGGVFSRHDKSIKLNKQIKKLLNLTQDYIVPNDLIKAILRAKVDLLWNGGIGTYVKASHQLHSNAGDRANNAVRINADQLRCKVVGEGGNLGFTQAARIEFALKGGAIYTDFIDNSAGVDCSDKEVNIKILLDKVVESNGLSEAQRNRMLREMTDEVAELVLKDNYNQTQEIDLASCQAVKQIDLYGRFMTVLEEKNILDRKLEDLPTAEQMTERKARGLGLMRPEIAVLVSYSKIFLQKRLLESDVPEDPWLTRYLFTAFPKRLRKRFHTELMSHRLRRELITTQLSNDLVNEMGAVFIYRMYHETGATYTDIVRAYAAAREIFNMKSLWQEVQNLDYKVDAAVQNRMLLIVGKLIRRSSRWLIRRYRENLDIAAIIDRYKNDVQKLFKLTPGMLIGERLEHFNERYEEFIEKNVPADLASKIATCDIMFSALEIAEETHFTNINVKDLAKAYIEVGQQLNLSWLRYQIRQQKNETHWEGLALAGIFDDIDGIQRRLASNVLQAKGKSQSIEKQVENWQNDNQRLVMRWQKMITSMRNSNSISPVMLFVGLRELTDLVQTCSLQS